MKNYNILKRKYINIRILTLLSIILLAAILIVSDKSMAEAAGKNNNKKNSVKSVTKKKIYKLNRTSIKLKSGGSTRLKLKRYTGKVKWKSVNPKIAKVSAKGVVKAVKAGNTRVYARVGKKKYICKVHVAEKKPTPSTIPTPTIAPTTDPIQISNIVNPTQTPLPTPEPTKRPPAPGRVVIHRGMTSVAPENSLAACEKAFDEGYQYVEIDVRFTYDNVPVLIHDEKIDRVSNGSGYIKDMTYEQVLSYDFGKRDGYAGMQISSLESVIALCKLKGGNLYIEIKDKYMTGQQADIIHNIIKQYDMYSNISFISFYNEPLKILMEKMPQCRCGFLVYSYMDEELEDILKELDELCENEVFIDIRMDRAGINDENSKIVDAFIKEGYVIEAWTFNDPYDPLPELLSLLKGYTTNL